MALVKIAGVNDVGEGSAKVVQASGKTIALFKTNGKFYAIDNTCLHRGGPLGEGDLDGTTVTCPLHGWQYDITSGENVMPGSGKVNAYKVEVQGNDVMVDV